VIRIIPLALALALIAPAAAYADDPQPTPEQLEQAKKAFADGKKLHEAGNYAEAVEKFKESYRLSKNPLLLYNIGFTMDEAKEADMALFYYRKFLKEAPAEAPQRPSVVERVKVLEQQFNPNPSPDPAVTAGNPTGPAKPEPGPKAPIVIKPPGTYSANDFEHQIIETAPPGKPLDITAFVPEDSGFVVTLYFRTAGEGKFTSKVMKWRYKELVGRIPAPKMIGNAVQYYIEVKDTAGTVVTRNGKSTSPNLVNLEAGASPRFYPDLNDEGEIALTATDIRKRDEEDDPLNRDKKIQVKDKKPDEPAAVVVGPPPAPGNGFRDVGSQKFRYTKWGSTGAAAALVGLSVVFFVQAGNYARALEDDSKLCGAPPCRMYDSYAADVQDTGKRYQTLSSVTLGLGVAATAVAGYFWYKELAAKKRGELNASTKKGPPPQTSSWNVAPMIDGGGTGFFGAAAARQF